jgi:hypothetical protein
MSRPRPLVALAAATVAAILAVPLLSAPAIAAPAAPMAQSADVVTWSVRPANSAGSDARQSLAYAVDPGTEIKDFVAISNFGTTPATFSVYPTDARNDFATGAFGLLAADQKPKDVGSWITTQDSKVTIAPNESAIVPFTMLVPSDASPGDHTGGIIASILVETQNKKGQAVTLDERVATRVYLRVSGDPVSSLKATGMVTGFAPSWNPFGGGDATVDFAVKNDGNVRSDVAQQLTLSGPFGIQLATRKLDPIRNLLPGQDARVHVQASGIAPLLLLFADVKLTPSTATDLVAQSQLQDQSGAKVEKLEQPKFAAASFSAFTGAISWMLLIIVVVLAVLVWLLVRYVRVTRERLYDAIDQASEEARTSALAEAGQEGEPSDRPTATVGS